MPYIVGWLLRCTAHVDDNIINLLCALVWDALHCQDEELKEVAQKVRD